MRKNKVNTIWQKPVNRNRSQRIFSQLNRFHIVVVLILCATTVLIGTVAVMKVFAQDAPICVKDGSSTYTIGANVKTKEAAIEAAQQQGMAGLTPEDLVEYIEDSNTWVVRRCVDLLVDDSGRTYEFKAYKGDTVGDTLEKNGVAISETDQVTPNIDTVIGATIKVDIKRLCRVNVTADGETVQIKLTEGTVADVLDEAKIKLGDKDTCNHDLTEPIKNDMHVVVSRVVSVSVTDGGKTRTYEASAATIAGILEECGIKLGTEDKINVSLEAVPRDGMRIVIERIETKEEKEVEELDYSTKFLHTLDMAEGETKLLTPGMKGKKELVYQAIYVNGKLKSRELISEKVTAEPIKELILKGAGYKTVPPKLEFEGSDNSESIGNGDTSNNGQYSGPTVSVNASAGTITDDKGQTVSYTKAITGTCTAYCIPGGTTSIGLEAVRGVIAVDPDIIPYGTRMYVASPDGQIVYGYGVAGDTGGACMAGDIIADLCYDTIEECSIIGRRDMVLYILD